MFALVTTQLAFGCIAATKPGVEAPTGPPADTTVTSSGVLLCEAPEERDTLGPMYTPDWGDEWAAQPEYEDENAVDPGWGVAIEDFDGDGVLEILLANPFGTQLYEWDPDTHAMVEHTPQLPSLSSQDVRSASAGDYDGDGDLYLYLGVSKGADLLLRNDGAGAFEDVTRSAGLLEETWTGTSATWGDVNGDGNLELFVANSAMLAEVSSNGEPDHNVYSLNNGDGTLSDATRTLPGDRKHERHGGRHTPRAYIRFGSPGKQGARQKGDDRGGKVGVACSCAHRPRSRPRVNPPVVATRSRRRAPWPFASPNARSSTATARICG